MWYQLYYCVLLQSKSSKYRHAESAEESLAAATVMILACGDTQLHCQPLPGILSSPASFRGLKKKLAGKFELTRTLWFFHHLWVHYLLTQAAFILQLLWSGVHVPDLFSLSRYSLPIAHEDINIQNSAIKSNVNYLIVIFSIVSTQLVAFLELYFNIKYLNWNNASFNCMLTLET